MLRLLRCSQVDSKRKAIVVLAIAVLLFSAFTSLDADSLYAALALTFCLFVTTVTLRYKQTEAEAIRTCPISKSSSPRAPPAS